MDRFTLEEVEIKNLQKLNLNYDVICNRSIHTMNRKKEYIGSKYNKICRFCGRDKNTTTFNTISHAIPELIGNKTLVSYYECDQCNAKFSSTLENHLSEFLSFIDQ